MQIRTFYLSLALFYISILAAAFEIEHISHIPPCSLCIIQRFLLGGLIGVCIVAARTHTFWLNNILKICGSIFAVLGIMAAARQLWLMYHPTHVGSCAADLLFLIKHFPLHTAWEALISGSPSCTHAPKLFGASLPTWSLISFSIGLLGFIFTGRLTKESYS